MVHALKAAPGVDAALGERGEAVGALIVEHLPPPFVPVPPDHHVEAHHRLGVGGPLVEVAYRGERVPLGEPVEFLVAGEVFVAGEGGGGGCGRGGGELRVESGGFGWREDVVVGFYGVAVVKRKRREER